MRRAHFLAVWFLVPCLVGCDDRNLHFKVHYRQAEGLSVGAPVVYDNRAIGTVQAVESDPAGGYLAEISLPNKFAAATTVDSRFYLEDNPEAPGKKRIEIEQAKPGGSVLAQGAVIEGSERWGGRFPFGEIVRQFTEGLRIFRDQLHGLEEELRQFPDSEEAKRLEQEWRRLAEEIQRAQGETEESLRKEWLPKLQKELEQLEERFQELKRQKKPAGQPAI